MADKKPESFKVGEAYRQPVTVGNKKRGSEKEATPESQSLGFARIESIIENEDPAAISSSLTNIHNALDALSSQAKASNKDKAEAAKAMIAVEHAADLLDYLFQTKSALIQQAGGSAKK